MCLSDEQCEGLSEIVEELQMVAPQCDDLNWRGGFDKRRIGTMRQSIIRGYPPVLLDAETGCGRRIPISEIDDLKHDFRDHEDQVRVAFERDSTENPRYPH